MGVIRALYMFVTYGVFIVGFVAAIAAGFSMSAMSIAYGKPMAWFGSCAGLPPRMMPYCRRCQKWSLIFFGAIGVGLILGLINGVTGIGQR